MRRVWILTAGLAVALAAYRFSQAAEGLPGAIAYMLSLLLVPLTVGFAITAGTTNRHRSARAGRLFHWLGAHGLRKPRIVELTRCGGCGRSKVVMESVWVCAHCDHAPVSM